MSEPVTLAIAGQWARVPSEAACYRYAQKPLRLLCPTLPSRPQFNRLVREYAVTANRLQKSLDGANSKLASVVTEITGKSGRVILRALVDGETDPDRLMGGDVSRQPPERRPAPERDNPEGEPVAAGRPRRGRAGGRPHEGLAPAGAGPSPSATRSCGSPTNGSKPRRARTRSGEHTPARNATDRRSRTASSVASKSWVTR